MPYLRRSIFNDSNRISEYLKIPQGQCGRYNWRKRHGCSHYLFDMEPRSKKAMKVEGKVAFQREILRQMKQLHRAAYRGRIVAELSINLASKTPPHIHTIVKNLLDNFSTPLPKSRIRRKGLIYQDDRQIVYLSVRYHIGNNRSQILASFAPFRHFLLDLALAKDIISGEYDDYFDDHDFLKNIGEIEDYYGDLDGEDKIAWDSLKDLTRNKDKCIQRFGKQGYDSLIKMDQMQLQESFVKRCRLSVRDIYTLYHAAGKIPKVEDVVFPELKKCTRNLSSHLTQWITNSPVKIQLSRIPIRENETQQFKREVRESIRRYREKYKTLEPLHIPITLEVIYKPPPVSQGFFKDLDNIMRLILPIFHEEFKPPPTFISNMNLNDISDERFLEKMKPLIEALPKSVKYSIAGYEIFEIPRHQSDQDNGFISVGISGGVLGIKSLWDRVNEVIDKWQEHCERRY